MSSSANYHVFISFRGEDTRLNFTSHLHGALEEKGVGTFIDYKLKKGEEVWPKLASAIERSDISIVVFSEEYATSKWCLEELVKILECRNQKGQIVVPVFYNIDPSDVRKQTGSYAEAFAEHERYIGDDKSKQDEVSEWRAALTEASNISGWDSRHKDEFPFIQDIVNDVLQKLYLKYPNEIEVDGIDKVCEGIESLLKKVSKIGIWGMGGIGKTTIAKVMFAKHFPKHDSVCFMENVREQSQKLGETYTRDKLLFDLLKEQVPSNFMGSPFIKKRLSDKKKFIVLDDVDSYLQLDTLCAELGDLGKDSKLIVTTRNKHLLDGIVDEVYPVENWDSAKSLKLFSSQAFKDSNPPMGYEHFSKRAVEYAAGNPLALKVLGSHFRSRSPNFWESELKKFENKKESFKEIENVLRVSYNGLQESQQAIFLDIAFFFKDEDKHNVEWILNACDFFASSGMQILEDKALITISKSNTIQMHDLLQQMGMDIVRENLRKPGDFGRRSRLRDTEEVLDVLRKEGTAAVEGITLDLSPIKDLQLNADTFNMMTNLRFLQLHIPSGKRSETKYQRTDLKALPKKLRYLEWNGFPFKSLPPTFEAEFLVGIRLPYSHVKELWQGKQALALPNLEAIDLSECKQLIKLPDLSNASKLKWVYLSGCESLCVIHPSLLSLDTLDTLILDGCKKLKCLKSDKHLSSLKKLSVNGCSSLEEFSMSSELIKKLDFREAGVKTLHSLNISCSSKLRWLNLEGPILKNLGDGLSCVTTLEELKISHCGQVINKKKLHILFGGLVSLKVLHLKHCYRLYELPDNVSTLSSLRELMLDGSSVESLPASIKHLQGLKILSLRNCKWLQILPELPPSIEKFYAVNYTSLVTVPTLKTFALQMNGVRKYMSLNNGMKLNGSSLLSIMKDTEFTMLSAAFHNVLSTWYEDYYYNRVKVCLPGSNVPRSLTYQAKGSALEEGDELDKSLKLELESRRRALSMSIETKNNGIRTQIQNQEQHLSENVHVPVTALLMASNVDNNESKLWPDSVTKAFIDIMVDEATKGNMQNDVFQARIWNSMTDKLNTMTNCSYKKDQLEAKMHRLRAQYHEFYKLLQHTGFGWNAETNIVTANEEVCQDYLWVNDKAAQFQKKGCDHYKLLGMLFNRNTATGVLHHSSTQDPPNTDEENELESQYLNTSSHADVDNDSLDDDTQELEHIIRSGKHEAQVKEHKSKKVSRTMQMGDALVVKVEVFKAKAEKSMETTSSPVTSDHSCTACVVALEAIPNIPDDTYVKALKKFMDAQWREMFLAMSVNRKRAWLFSL